MAESIRVYFGINNAKKKEEMTSRERLQILLRGEIPDCVPVAPDS